MKKKKLGKFYYHEAIDRLNMMCCNIQDFILDHPVFTENKKYSKKAEKAQRLLAELYQTIGGKRA